MPRPQDTDARPHAPRSVLVAEAGRVRAGAPREAGAGTMAEVLDDVADALRAYDRLARASAGGGDGAPLEVWREAPDAEAAGGRRVAEALVVGLSGGGALPVALAGLPVRAGALAYAVIEVGDAAEGPATADGLGAACEWMGLRWAGALLVPREGLVPGLLRHPRMGALRRPLSEATDDLIAAVRSGLTVAEAARLFSWEARMPQGGHADLIVVRRSAASRLLIALFATLAGYRRSR